MRERKVRLGRHLAAKDWSYLWGWLVLAWVVCAAQWLYSVLPFRPWLESVARIHPLFVGVFVLLAQTRLWMVDPLFDTTAFWRTRPIGSARLLAAKVGSSFLLLVAPCSLIETLPLVVNPGLPERDLLLTLSGSLLWYGAFCAMAALIALFSRDLPTNAVLLAASAFVLLSWYGYRHRASPPEPLTLHGAAVEASRNLVLALFAIGASVLTLIALGRTRRRREALVLIGLALLLAFLLEQSWTLALVEPLAPRPTRSTDGRAPELRLRVVGPGGKFVDGYGPVTSGGIREARLSLSFAVDGPGEGLVLVQTGYDTAAVVGDQGNRRVHADVQRPAPVLAWWPYPAESALPCRNPAIHPPWETSGAPAGHMPFEVYRLRTAAPDDDSTPALSALRGRLFLSVRRPRVVARVAVRPGAVLSAPGHRLRIVQTSDGRLPLAVRMIREYVSPPIFGHAFATPPGWLLFYNARRAECLGKGGLTGSFGLPLPLRRVENTWGFDLGPLLALRPPVLELETSRRLARGGRAGPARGGRGRAPRRPLRGERFP